MRKLHWISLSLIAAPLVLMHACGGDDSTPGGTAGSAGKGGSGGGTGGSATGGSATGGSATGGGTTGGSAGTGGAKTDGGGGSPTDGGGGVKVDGAGGALPDVVVGDVVVSDVIMDGGNPSKKCEDDASADAFGQTCNDFCDKFMATCNDDAIFSDAGGKPFANPGECRQQCANFANAALCCYITHVDNAIKYDGGTRSQHCTHAAGSPGNMVCPVRQ